MTNIVPIANAESRPRRTGDFMETATALDVLRSLDLIRSMPDCGMTMISGAPGVGKTKALRHFCAAQGYDALYHSIPRGEGRPTAIAEHVLGFFGMDANGMSLALRGKTMAQYVGPGRVLLLDEAQHLTVDGAEWVRAIAEAGNFDLVLCGDLALEPLVQAIPQLYSRMQRKVVVREVCREDVAAIVSGSSFDIAPAIDALHAIARLRGGLRNVENVLRMARLFAGNARPTVEHLKAAIADMKLGPKGGAQ